MKIKIDYFDNQIEIDNENINVIEIENKKYFYRFISDINSIIQNGFSDSIILFDNNIEKNLNGKIKLYIDYFNFGFDSKKYEKEINKYVIDLINDETKNNLLSQYNKIIKIYNKILNNTDLPLIIDNDNSVETLTKCLKIVVDNKKDLLENILLLIDLEKTLKTNNLLFFINLKQYLNEVELLELYKYATYNQINIILIDSQSYGCKLKYEKKLIIDENLDEFLL